MRGRLDAGSGAVGGLDSERWVTQEQADQMGTSPMSIFPPMTVLFSRPESHVADFREIHQSGILLLVAIAAPPFPPTGGSRHECS